MRLFRLTENKLFYIVLANVESKKNFFLYESSQLRHASNLFHFIRYFPKRVKSAILFYYCFFFYLKGGNLEAALLRVLTILLIRTLDKMIKALKIPQLNVQKLRLKSKNNTIKLLERKYNFH